MSIAMRLFIVVIWFFIEYLYLICIFAIEVQTRYRIISEFTFDFALNEIKGF